MKFAIVLIVLILGRITNRLRNRNHAADTHPPQVQRDQFLDLRPGEQLLWPRNNQVAILRRCLVPKSLRAQKPVTGVIVIHAECQGVGKTALAKMIQDSDLPANRFSRRIIVKDCGFTLGKLMRPAHWHRWN